MDKHTSQIPFSMSILFVSQSPVFVVMNFNQLVSMLTTACFYVSKESLCLQSSALKGWCTAASERESAGIRCTV